VNQAYPDPVRRFFITLPTMIASTMVAVDITIANVALPHMQSTMSASQDQIVWVLTSYVIAGAIATPLSGWLASRYGRRPVMIVSVAGFTLASAGCGAANDLTAIVLARLLQGACGAALVPLSQAILLDINPPERHGKAMAMFSLGSMAGPVLGPTLGGWLTDSFSWRWVFFVNVPFGIAATLLMLAFFSGRKDENPGKFDVFGFGVLALGLGAFQLMLDRGELVDWFESTEIWLYAAIAALSAYLTIVHLATSRQTFIRPELFRDRNFTVGCMVSMCVGLVVFATLPPIIVMTQTLYGYTALHTGIVGMPRALGTAAMALIVPRFYGKVDTRLMIMAGLALTGISMMFYARLDLYADEWALVVAGLLQGAGGGMLFLPLSVMVFSTLPRELRNEGAAMNSLMRSIGNAIGISWLQRELIHFTAASRASLVEGLRPDSPAVQYARPDIDFGSAEAMVRLNHEVARQAAMVGNVQTFWLAFALSLAMVPLVLMMKNIKNTAGGYPLPATE